MRKNIVIGNLFIGGVGNIYKIVLQKKKKEIKNIFQKGIDKRKVL